MWLVTLIAECRETTGSKDVMQLPNFGASQAKKQATTPASENLGGGPVVYKRCAVMAGIVGTVLGWGGGDKSLGTSSSKHGCGVRQRRRRAVLATRRQPQSGQRHQYVSLVQAPSHGHAVDMLRVVVLR